MQDVVLIHKNNHVDCFGNHYPTRKRIAAGRLSYTCAIDLIEVDFLLSFPEQVVSAIQRGESLPISFGYAICHPHDCFCKKTGASIAKARLKTTDAKIVEYTVERLTSGVWFKKIVLFIEEISAEIVIKQTSNKRHFKIHILELPK